jgi:hypothetical protein
MSETIAPTIIVSLGLGLATTTFGVFVEKHYVSKWSVLFNCMGIGSLALSLKPSQTLEFVLLFAYAIIGAILVASKKKGKIVNGVKHLFGSKMYGAIALAYAFHDLDGSYVSTLILKWLESVGFPNFFASYIVFFSWIVILTCVLIASVIVMLRSHQKTSG